MNYNNILLSGAPGIGKSTIIRRYVDERGLTARGFKTYPVADNGEYDNICISSYEDEQPASAAVVAVRGLSHDTSRSMTAYPEVFDDVGSRILGDALEAPDTELIILDELGFMENEAYAFQDAVLRCLDSDIPVLGVIKTLKQSTPFLDAIRARDDVLVIDVTLSNRDNITIPLD